MIEIVFHCEEESYEYMLLNSLKNRINEFFNVSSISFEKFQKESNNNPESQEFVMLKPKQFHGKKVIKIGKIKFKSSI